MQFTWPAVWLLNDHKTTILRVTTKRNDLTNVERDAHAVEIHSEYIVICSVTTTSITSSQVATPRAA